MLNIIPSTLGYFWPYLPCSPMRTQSFLLHHWARCADLSVLCMTILLILNNTPAGTQLVTFGWMSVVTSGDDNSMSRCLMSKRWQWYFVGLQQRHYITGIQHLANVSRKRHLGKQRRSSRELLTSAKHHHVSSPGVHITYALPFLQQPMFTFPLPLCLSGRQHDFPTKIQHPSGFALKTASKLKRNWDDAKEMSKVKSC